MRGLFAGQALVVFPRFDTEEVLRRIQDEQDTWVLLVPTMMHRIWRLPDEVRLGYDVSSLRTVLHLGAPCPPWLKRGWLD